jgi:ABC-type Mn2+/Zn2+ transport system ATPase subunit
MIIRQKPGRSQERWLVLTKSFLDVPHDIEQTPINLQIMKHTVTMITGPTGSGKSTFLRAMLGETATKH